LDILDRGWHMAKVRRSTTLLALGLSLCLPACKSREADSKLEQAKALTAKQPAAALQQLDRVLAEGGDRLEVGRAKAAAHQRLGQLPEAEKLLLSVLAEAPEDHEALDQLANVCVAQGKLDEARRHLTIAIRRKPPHVPTLLLFATLAATKADGSAGLAAFDLLKDDGYRTFRKSAEYATARAALLSAQDDDRTAALAWLSQHEKSRSFDPKLSLLMAGGLAKLGKGSLALWLLARASNSPNAGTEVHEALAERALAMNDEALAKLALSRMGGQLSQTPNILLLEARLLELQDQGLEATKLTRRALDLVPADREKQKTAYALAHARSLAKEGLLEEARQVLTEVLQKEPEHGRAKLLLGAIEIQADHGERVEPLVEELLADPRYAPQAQTLVVRAHLALKNPAAAKKAARGYFDKAPADLHTRLLLVQTLAQAGEGAAGLELLDRAPAAVATQPELVRMRVELAEKFGSPAQTEAMVSDYLRQGVDLPELRRSLGRSLIRQQRLPDAEAVFRDLARDDPSALEEVARLQREQHRLPEAIATLERAVAASPLSHSAWLLLGLMKKEGGDGLGAAAAYERALRLEPNDPVALNNLAVLLIEQGHERTRAISLARRAVASLPDNPALEDTFGWALIEGGDEKQISEAVELLERSSSRLGTAEAAFHLGVALARAKRDKEAKVQLTRALQPATDATRPPAWRPRAEQALAALP
jgi:tetratricopeptide (TPR) repeat protein